MCYRRPSLEEQARPVNHRVDDARGYDVFPCELSVDVPWGVAVAGLGTVGDFVVGAPVALFDEIFFISADGMPSCAYPEIVPFALRLSAILRSFKKGTGVRRTRSSLTCRCGGWFGRVSNGRRRGWLCRSPARCSLRRLSRLAQDRHGGRSNPLHD